MNYDISLYKVEDLEPLNEFLNANWEYDTVSRNVLSEKLEGDPFWFPDATFVCKDEGRIVGFMQGVLRDIRGTRYGYIKTHGRR